MKILHNQDLDLNLLHTLYVLLEEQNVTKAASRLALSQSAVSHSLNKLRDYFNDPLLVKSRSGMIATAVAEELRGKLRIILDNIRDLHINDQFDPATAKGTIRVAASDYGASIIFPPLMERLAGSAHNLKIDCVPISQNVRLDLEKGIIDIAFGGYKAFDGILHEVLFYDRYVGIARANHPILKGKITKRRLLEWKHVLIKVPHRNERKERLYKQLGYHTSDDFYLEIPYHMIACLSVEKTDMILIMPEKGAGLITRLADVTLFELPIKMEDHAYLQSWHRRSDEDKMHQWLRNQVKEVCKSGL